MSEGQTSATALLVCAFAALSLVFWLRIDNSIWFDEAVSIEFARGTFSDTIWYLKRDNGPPLYYLILSLWMRGFGSGEFAVKGLSLVLHLLSLYAVYLCGRAFFDRQTALLCLLLYMVSPLSIRHALNVRMYSLLELIAIVSTCMFLRLFCVDNPARRSALLYVTANVIGVFTHYWFMFLLFSHVVCYAVLFRWERWKQFAAMIAFPVGLFGLLWSEIFLYQLDNGSTEWLKSPGVVVSLIDTLLDFYGRNTAVFVYTALLLVVLVRISKSGITLTPVGELAGYLAKTKISCWFVLFFAPLAAALAVSQVKPVFLTGRYTIILLFPFVMFVGPLLARFGDRRLVSMCCWALVLGLVLNVIRTELEPAEYSDKETARYLARHAKDNDVLLFAGLSRPSVEYYLGEMGRSQSFRKISFPMELAEHPTWVDGGKLFDSRHKLGQQADAIVAGLGSVELHDDNRVWVFHSRFQGLNEIIEARLESSFSLIGEKDLKGSFFDGVLEYRKRPSLGPPGGSRS